MVDKSWGEASSPGFRVRTNKTPADRMAARASRAAERAAAMAERAKIRSETRATEARQREEARTARREEEARSAAADPHAAAAARRRSSGRKDVVREQRDTRGYTTIVDVERIRRLAGRGASVAGLAGAFGISVAEVERALADPA